ncbi:MAG: hypothetical protein VR70_10510 [Rhodospirillaceae bacterium BRH_c57]|nr:MAG: hypothetical protein VR70_10510 [Rhodospirillaceae bacterium BRH_c57]
MSAMTIIDLFGPRPRRKPRVMMHVYDAGEVPGMGCAICLRCARCGHDTDWVLMRTLSEDKRGRPCPNCNERETA